MRPSSRISLGHAGLLIGRTLCCWLLLAHSSHALQPVEVDHLLRRAAFSTAPGDETQFLALSREQAVDRLIEEAVSASPAPLPSWAKPLWHPDRWGVEPPHKNPKLTNRILWDQARAWFLESLLADPSPLRARMLLHWHGYFPLILQKHSPSAVRRDHELAELALGDYREVIDTFARSGATMENLDLKRNRRGALNENFARELLELYTLGHGHYSQADIRDAARAFTGWAVHRRLGLFMVIWPWHDFGQKTVLGHSGRLDGDDVLDILYQHPRFAEHQIERLWRTFISPQPDAKLVTAWSEGFRKNDYSLAWLLGQMLKSDAFWSQMGARSLVRSPVELVIGELRAHGVQHADGRWMSAWSTAMGQTPYLAPDVKGWPVNEDWFSVGSVSVRQAFLDGMANGFLGERPAAMTASMMETPSPAMDSGTMRAADAAEAFAQMSHEVWAQIEQARASKHWRALKVAPPMPEVNLK